MDELISWITELWAKDEQFMFVVFTAQTPRFALAQIQKNANDLDVEDVRWLTHSARDKESIASYVDRQLTIKEIDQSDDNPSVWVVVTDAPRPSVPLPAGTKPFDV